MSVEPIGIFDSGVGGLTVLEQISRTLPHEPIVYLGDTARVPYGDKSPEAILRYSLDNTMFLMDKGIKLLVIACNTASAHAAAKVRRFFKIPVVDVIEAGVAQAIQETKSKRIAVLGTRATIHSGVYKNEILKLLPDAHVTMLACPLFVPLVEEQFIDHPATRLIIRDYLEPLKVHRIDALLLGCTHYPLLAHLIKEELGSEVAIIDAAAACAKQVASLLGLAPLLGASSRAEHKYYVSDDPAKFKRLAEQFLGHGMICVEKVRLGGIH